MVDRIHRKFLIIWRRINFDSDNDVNRLSSTSGILNYFSKCVSRITSPYLRLAYEYDLCSSYFAFDSDPNSNRYSWSSQPSRPRRVDAGKEREEAWMRPIFQFHRPVMVAVATHHFLAADDFFLLCLDPTSWQLHRSHRPDLTDILQIYVSKVFQSVSGLWHGFLCLVDWYMRALLV